MQQRHKIIITYWLGYLLFFCSYCYLHNIDRYRNSQKLKAEVVDQLIATGRRRIEYRYPQFAFMYKDSLYYLAENKSYTRGMKTGKKATVIFLKGDPENAIVYNFFAYWVGLSKLLLNLVISIFLYAVLFIFIWYDKSQEE